MRQPRSIYSITVVPIQALSWGDDAQRMWQKFTELKQLPTNNMIRMNACLIYKEIYLVFFARAKNYTLQTIIEILVNQTPSTNN